jgi:hypothetical protein
MTNPFLCLTFLLILISSSNSFGQTRKTLDSWIGHSKKSLLQKWGLPDRQGEDGGDGYIVAYRTTDFKGEKWTSFYLDDSNVIKSWSTKSIPPQIIKVQPTNGWNFDKETYRTPRN